jgi:hypothetical protein
MADECKEPQLHLFDVDAQAELRHMPLASVQSCPRTGEQVEVLADREHGGGVYDVVGVTHRIADIDKTGACVTGIVVSLKPKQDPEAEAEVALVAEVLTGEKEVRVSDIVGPVVLPDPDAEP